VDGSLRLAVAPAWPAEPASGAGDLYPIRRIVLVGDRRFAPDTILGSFDTRNGLMWMWQ
jgi:hypothetical protein